MKRRDYLASVGSIALFPILINSGDKIEIPEVEDYEWMQSTADGKQILEVETTHAVDRVKLRRYEFGESSSEPRHEKQDDTTHELVWDSPTTIFGLHSLALIRNEQVVNELTVEFDIDLLTRHIDARENNVGRVAVRQKGDGTLAAYSGCIVTDNEQQPDFDDVANWQNQHHEQLSHEYTIYLQARITNEALSRMRGHQTVSVWVQNENDGWFPSTVDFSDEGYDPIEVYDLHGVKRY